MRPGRWCQFLPLPGRNVQGMPITGHPPHRSPRLPALSVLARRPRGIRRRASGRDPGAQSAGGDGLATARRFSPRQGRAMWLRHVIDAERTTRGLPRAIVTYDALLSDWQGVIASLGAGLGVSWPRRGAVAVTFSTITMASSTTNPVAIVSAIRDRLLRL
jgi:hypothetical protein